MVSKAPALISDSVVRLLQTTASTLSRKSGKEAYLPLALRLLMIDSTTFVPTLRTAVEAEEDHVVALGGEVRARTR